MDSLICMIETRGNFPKGFICNAFHRKFHPLQPLIKIHLFNLTIFGATTVMQESKTVHETSLSIFSFGQSIQ